jgi:CheY-like chemotaxis protein
MGSAAKHILIVDDEEAVRYVFERYLSMVGYRVSGAASGVDALRLHAVDRADLVVTDYRMPGMNGAELMTRLRAVDAALPGILISANPVDVGPLPDGVAFFQKPVLFERVHAHLAGVFSAASSGRTSTPAAAHR